MEFVEFFAKDWKVEIPKPHLEGLEFVDEMSEWSDEPIDVMVGYTDTPAMLLYAVKANRALNRMKGAIKYIRSKMDTEEKLEALRHREGAFGHNSKAWRELWEINHQLAIALKEKARYEKHSDGNDIFDWMMPGHAPELPTFTDLDIAESLMCVSGKRNRTAFRYVQECYEKEVARLKEERRQEMLRREKERRRIMLETAYRMEKKREADDQLMVRTIRRYLGDGVVEIQKVLTAFYVKHTSRETNQVTISAIVPSVLFKNMAIRSYGFCSFRKAHPEIHRFFKSENITFEDHMGLY